MAQAGIRVPGQFRSTSFRLGTAYAIFFFVSVMIILGMIYVAAKTQMQGIVSSGVAADIARLRDAFDRHGAEGLQEVASELTEDPLDDHFYALIGPDGRTIAANVPPTLWQPGAIDRKISGDAAKQSPSLASAADRDLAHEVRFLGTGVTLGEYRVLVAQNANLLDDTQDLILAILMWSGLVTTLLALVGGYIVSTGPTKRVDAIAAMMRTVAIGQLDIRLPISGRHDELDRLSGDINGTLERIETLMSSLKQVSTDIAHDLRTPLSRLHLKLERAREAALTHGGDAVAVEDAIHEVDGIITTFDALLRISQIEAGARKGKFQRLDISVLLLQLYEVYEGVAEEEGHHFELDLEPELAIEGDRDLLQQLFANLVENAMTHVPAPATIRLAAVRQPDGMIAASVADSGPGVPECERERIFRRLYRLDRSRTTPGNGLGLAMVAAIAELHGATVLARDNQPGLRVELVFPTFAG